MDGCMDDVDLAETNIHVMCLYNFFFCDSLSQISQITNKKNLNVLIFIIFCSDEIKDNTEIYFVVWLLILRWWTTIIILRVWTMRRTL